MSTGILKTTTESFQIRYSLKICIKGHQNWQKLKIQISTFTYCPHAIIHHGFFSNIVLLAFLAHKKRLKNILA